MLPGNLRSDLQAMVEQEEVKTMEALMGDLKAIDSGPMVDRIEKILLNKSSEQYEIEAALFTMLSKYGTLYNKKLIQYRGQFLWYEALGGRV